jgi:catechol 2,3-dioxygenase-like lactoylglutathione lyase family enzyme
MLKDIVHIALVVKDYDEAINYYTLKLGFILIEDTKLSEHKRWVLVSPNRDATCKILLAKGVGEKQVAAIGNQTGGRVFLFLQTDNFWDDYNRFIANDVEFIRPPSNEEYGTVAVFKDLYGNLWDLIEYK